MRVYLKIYKVHDADLYALHGAGISISRLIKLVLAYRARGKILNILVPTYITYSMDGKKLVDRVRFDITDDVSVRFLRNAIKLRKRTGYLKTILRESMVFQTTGVFLRDAHIIQKEKEKLYSLTMQYMEMDDLLICVPGDTKYPCLSMIRNRTLDISGIPEDIEEDTKKEKKRRKIPADIAALYPDKTMLKKEKEKQEKQKKQDKKPVSEPEQVTVLEPVPAQVQNTGQKETPKPNPAETERKDEGNVMALPVQDPSLEEDLLTEEEAEEDYFKTFEDL